ncbi:MAG: hypothetical protein ACTHOK_03180 [Nocardioidaceae bacterium]
MCETEGQALEECLAATDAWLTGFSLGFERVTDQQHAQRLARLCRAVGRGVLFEVALTRDREAADAVIDDFTEMLRDALGDPPA